MRAEGVSAEAQILDRLLKWLALAVAVAVVAFAVYYTADRRADPGPALMDRTISQAEQAVRQDPASANARLVLADLYLAKNRSADAIAQYRAALQIDGQLVRAHRGLGLTYLDQDRFDLAGSELQQVVDAKKDGEFAHVDKDLEEAYFLMARAQLGQQKRAEAIGSLERALRIDTTDADAWHLLGSAYLAAGKPDAALAAVKKAVLFVPNFAEAYQTLAQVYQARGEEVGVRYARAMASYSKGDAEQAIGELQAVTRTKPDFWDAWTGLGLAYEAALRKSEAAGAYRTALGGAPGDFNATTGLARLGRGQR